MVDKLLKIATQVNISIGLNNLKNFHNFSNDDFQLNDFSSLKIQSVDATKIS